MKKEILFAYFSKNTCKRCRDLKKIFGDLDSAWKAEFDELKKTGWQDNLIHEFLLWKDEIDEEKIQIELDKEKISCVTIEEDKYPLLLKQISDPPVCLFYRGNIDSIGNSIAMVGTRKYSPYGKQVAQKISHELIENDIIIVSGLALGIDGICHETSVDNNKRTLAVLGGGIDKQYIYPSIHKLLADKIIDNGGAIVSEYPPGSIPNKFTFPKRNRIIAGLTLGTVVVEAPIKSGALITSQCALDYNREVFAVPHPIHSEKGSGNNNLIKNGAALITSGEDILESLNLQLMKKKDTINVKPNSPEEKNIIDAWGEGQNHIDELIRKTKMDQALVGSTLSMMELDGKVKNIGNMTYVLVN